MSARDELYNELRVWFNRDELTMADQMLDAYRDEVLREAAEKIRSQKGSDHKPNCEYCLLYDISADLIDPEGS